MISQELLCPICGNHPKLIKKFARGFSYGENSSIIIKLECRKWFSLRLCFGPHRGNWIENYRSDLGLQVATERWNSAVLATTPRRLV